MATVEQTVRQALWHFPTLFENRTQVLHHIFFVGGNGYEWQDGEPIALTDYDGLKDEDAYWSLQHSDSQLIQEINEGLAAENNTLVDFVRAHIDLLASSLGDLKPMGFPPGMYDTEGLDPGLYPWTDYCLINHIPDDVKPDWLEAADYMMNRFYGS